MIPTICYESVMIFDDHENQKKKLNDEVCQLSRNKHESKHDAADHAQKPTSQKQGKKIPQLQALRGHCH